MLGESYNAWLRSTSSPQPRDMLVNIMERQRELLSELESALQAETIPAPYKISADISRVISILIGIHRLAISKELE